MPDRRRVLLLDIPLAVLIAAASWFAAQAANWMRTMGPEAFERGRRWSEWADWSSFQIWWTPLPFVVIMAGGLAVRRLRPQLGFVVVVAAVTGYLALGTPYGPVLLAPMLATYALAAAQPVRRWAPLVILLVPMLTARFWTAPDFGLLDPQFYGALVVGIAAIMVPAMIGLLRRGRIQTQRAERDTELRRIAYEERLRVAREVHDVVGHSLSVISMQAGVALHVLDQRPDQSRESLTAIRNTSREALAELRSTLAVFRDPEVPRAPEAGLSRLPGLVAALEAAGRRVVVEDHRRTRELPAAVDLAALRIVQESLTNVVRHTTDATATVELADDGTTLTLMITDDGPPLAELVEGSGIAGLRERARSVGGTAQVVRRPLGGVQVIARLPVHVPIRMSADDSGPAEP